MWDVDTVKLFHILHNDRHLTLNDIILLMYIYKKVIKNNCEFTEITRLEFYNESAIINVNSIINSKTKLKKYGYIETNKTSGIALQYRIGKAIYDKVKVLNI